MPNITLRRLNLETTATESAELVNTIMPDPVTIDRVREWGAAYLRTNKDSENLRILAINRKLGYEPQPGYFKCVKDLE